MLKKKKIIAILSVCIILVSCFSFTSFAYNSNYSVVINKPNTSQTEGYIEYLLQDSSGKIYPGVCFWSVTGQVNTSNNSESIPTVFSTITSTGINLQVNYYGSYVGEEYSQINCGTVFGYGWVSYYSSSSAFDVYIGEPNQHTLIAYKVYGNVEVSSYSIAPNSSIGDWSIMYQEDSCLYEAIISLAESQAGTGEVIKQSVADIQQNQNANTDKVTSNQDKNTQAIIDNQNQIQENERNEADTTINGSFDSAAGSIEDKSEGFLSALQSLVGVMSSTDTTCSWKFPSLKLPAIEGIMPEYVLTSEQNIDFSFWINKIPSNILELVRAVCTIALIVYCFKELYSVLAYALALKGGSLDE